MREKEQQRGLSRRQFIQSAGLTMGVFALGGRMPKVFAGGTLKVGALLPFTGPLSPFGEPLRNSIELAVDQVNKAGGPLGRSLEVIYRDSATDPAVGADAAKRLVEVDGVPAFIGAMSSGVSMAALSSVSAPSEAVQISPSSTSPVFTEYSIRGEDNGYFFRTTASDALQGKATGRVPWDLGHKTMSIIYVNNAYGEGLNEVSKQTFEGLGGQVVAEVPYEEGLPSYAGEVERAGRANADCLLLIAYPEDGITITRQWLELGFPNNIIASDGLKAREWVRDIGWDILEGTYGTAMGSVETVSNEVFHSTYEKKYGVAPPTAFMTNGYDALATIALAIQYSEEKYLDFSRVEQARAIRDSLRPISNAPGEKIFADEFAKGFDLIRQAKAIHYEGAAGAVDYDVNGDVAAPIEVWKVEGGDIVTHKIMDVSE